jgi:hypothetical protein
VLDFERRSADSAVLGCNTGAPITLCKDAWMFRPSDHYCLPYARITKGKTVRLLDFDKLQFLKQGELVCILNVNGRTAPRYRDRLATEQVISSTRLNDNEFIIETAAGFIRLAKHFWQTAEFYRLPYVMYEWGPNEVIGTGVYTRANPMSIPIEDVCPPVPTKEKVMSVMKEIGSIFVEGMKIHSSGDIAQKIVELFKEQLKDSYPKALSDNDLGRAVAPMLFPLLVYAVAQNYKGSNATMEKASKVAEYAMLGASKSLVDYANTLLPLFSSIGALSVLLETE